MRYTLLGNGSRCLDHIFRISFVNAAMVKTILFGYLALAATLAPGKRAVWRARPGALLAASLFTAAYGAYSIYCLLNGFPTRLF